jgi:hypothetical protein
MAESYPKAISCAAVGAVAAKQHAQLQFFQLYQVSTKPIMFYIHCVPSSFTLFGGLDNEAIVYIAVTFN